MAEVWLMTVCANQNLRPRTDNREGYAGGHSSGAGTPRNRSSSHCSAPG